MAIFRVVFLVVAFVGNSISAYCAEFDMVGVKYTPIVPIEVVSDTSTREIKNGDVLHEQDFRPATWVTPTRDIVLNDAFSDIKTKGRTDFIIKANTPYFQIVSKKTSEKSYCTNTENALLKWKKKTRPYRTCLVDTDNDGAFDKVYISSHRNNAVHNVGTFLMRNGLPIESVRYAPGEPDPNTIITCRVIAFKGFLAKSELNLVFIDKEQPKLSAFEVKENEVVGRFREFPASISLKGLELEIIDIIEGKIQYRVLSPFQPEFIYKLQSVIT